MKSIILGLVLFGFYSILISLFVYTPTANSQTTHHSLPAPLEQQLSDVLTEIYEEELQDSEELPVLVDESLPLEELEHNIEILTSESKKELTLEQVDALSIREARKVIAELNKGLLSNHKDRIRLKVNGKDHPKSWLISQIKMKLDLYPERVTEIVSAIRAVA